MLLLLPLDLFADIVLELAIRGVLGKLENVLLLDIIGVVDFSVESATVGVANPPLAAAAAAAASLAS
jgi:hypothetical protein